MVVLRSGSYRRKVDLDCILKNNILMIQAIPSICHSEIALPKLVNNVKSHVNIWK